jgi:hypothetical protein
MDSRTGIVLVVVLIATISLCVLLYVSMYREAYVNAKRSREHIEFLTREETRRFLLGDFDQYVRSLTEYDLAARRSTTFDEYRSAAAEASVDFGAEDKRMLSLAAQMADRFFLSLDGPKRVPGLEPHIVSALPWTFAKTVGKAYEDGLPHTRTEIIFLTNAHVNTQTDLTILTRLLIHEKIHVYQRYYPKHIEEYLTSINCQPHSERRVHPFVRANPDVNKWVYVCADAPALTMYEYAGPRPARISDIKHASQMEHPYEDMAYTVSALY